MIFSPAWLLLLSLFESPISSSLRLRTSFQRASRCVDEAEPMAAQVNVFCERSWAAEELGSMDLHGRSARDW